MVLRVIFAVISAILIISFELTSCLNYESTTEPITITFTFPESPDRSRYREIADSFEKIHPNITINLRPDPTGQWARNERNEVDVILWWPDPSLIDSGKPLITPVESLIKHNSEIASDDFFPPTLDMFKWRGSLWALPAEIDMQVIFFNKELFDLNGVDYPRAGWTWDDLLETAQKLTVTDEEASPDNGYYGLVSNPRWGDYISFIYQHGSDILSTDDPRTAEAVQWYTDLALVHNVMPKPDRVFYGDPHGYFREEKAAMWIGFLADRDGQGFHHLASPWDFEWGLAPLPKDQLEATLYRAQGYYVTSHTKHENESWEWIKFLSSKSSGKGFPARRSVAESSSFKALVGEDVASTGLHAVDHLVPRINVSNIPPDLLEEYSRTVESVVNDGNRFGFFKQPEFPRLFAIQVESVTKGEITAAEAMKFLNQK
ncbi:ABC transporter substrate-binding protein [Chloroflexota bacterium]